MKTPGRPRSIWRTPISLAVLSVGAGLLLASVSIGAEPANSKDAAGLLQSEAGSSRRVVPGEGFAYLGTIRPRHARQIEASNWSVGAETMDRDYTVYANWKDYLGPLGVKKARIQSGWAKTEKERGKYDWGWIDEIIPDMVRQGVEPWVCLCYGNPIYPGGGDVGLGGGMPRSQEALQAWERYVAAFVERYKQHVDEWEIWNEPRTGRGEGAVQYAQFVARTARTIRAGQPEATVIIAAGGSFDVVFAEQVLTWLRKRGELSLVDQVAYHPYSANPDQSYGKVAQLRKVVGSISPRIKIRQGENGCPSAPGGFGALGNLAWTERAQAKWALRRMLGDLGRDIPSSYFAICDMHYPNRVNYKGLLATKPDKTVDHVKPAYRAIQHLTAIFDNRLQRAEDLAATVSGGSQESRFAVFGYRGPGGGHALTLWRTSDKPDDRPEVEHVGLAVAKCRFESPVWIDLVSGRVFEIDAALWTEEAGSFVFKRVPVYDSVVLVADRRLIEGVLELD
jgi:hypothetical protein